MTRVKIGLLVTVAIAALTTVAYVLAAQRLEATIAAGVDARVARAERVFMRNASLGAIDLMSRAKGLAREPDLAKALVDPDANARAAAGAAVMKKFLAAQGPGAEKPDFIAVTNDQGQVVITDSPIPDAEDWKTRFKAIAAALDHGQVAKDVWLVGKLAVNVGVAPILDASGKAIGVVVLAETLSAKEASVEADLLGTEVLYFYGDQASASSFTKGSAIEDLSKVPELAALTVEARGDKPVTLLHVTVNGTAYVAAAGRLPLNFDDHQSGFIVLESLSAAEEPLGTVRLAIILFGLGALGIALLAMLLATRSMTAQIDEIELGVGDLINGNLEYQFRPVGADVDGLANALNVLLARMLGRAEPGDDEVPSDSAPSAVAEGGDAEAEIAALAREPEEQYFQRTFDEFIAARRSIGDDVSGATLPGFTAKLRLHEANLKKKHNCKAVRFRVVVAGNQVTLKPVPIV